MNRGDSPEHELETPGLDIRKKLSTIKVMKFGALSLKVVGFSITI